MPRHTTTLAVTAVAAIAGLVVYDAFTMLGRRASAGPRAPQGGSAPPPPPAPPQPERPTPPPQGFAPEPAEGFESRWLARRARAVRRCKQDTSVRTWPQAVTCVLNATYPEAAPWSDPSIGDPWMLDAASLVETDLAAEVEQMFPGTTPTGWQAVLWVRGSREIAACRAPGVPLAEVVRCAAAAIYPTMPWPPPAGSPTWMQEFWLALRRLVAGAA